MEMSADHKVVLYKNGDIAHQTDALPPMDRGIAVKLHEQDGSVGIDVPYPPEAEGEWRVTQCKHHKNLFISLEEQYTAHAVSAKPAQAVIATATQAGHVRIGLTQRRDADKEYGGCAWVGMWPNGHLAVVKDGKEIHAGRYEEGHQIEVRVNRIVNKHLLFDIEAYHKGII